MQTSILNHDYSSITLYHQHNTFAYAANFSLDCIYNNDKNSPLKPTQDHVWNFVDDQPRRSLFHYEPLLYQLRAIDPSGRRRNSVVTLYLDEAVTDEVNPPTHIAYHIISPSSTSSANTRRIWLPSCSIARNPLADDTPFLFDSSAEHSVWIQCETELEGEKRTLKVACWPDEEDMVDILDELTCLDAYVRTLVCPREIDLLKVIDLKMDGGRGTIVLTMDDDTAYRLGYAGQGLDA